jgi:hypothetical protein
MHFRILFIFLISLFFNSCTKKEIVFPEPPIGHTTSIELQADPEKVWTSLTEIFFERYEFDIQLARKGMGKIGTRWIHYVDNGVTYKFQVTASMNILKEGVVVSVYKHLMKLDSRNLWIALLSDSREEHEILRILQKRCGTPF